MSSRASPAALLTILLFQVLPKYMPAHAGLHPRIPQELRDFNANTFQLLVFAFVLVDPLDTLVVPPPGFVRFPHLPVCHGQKEKVVAIVVGPEVDRLLETLNRPDTTASANSRNANIRVVVGT